MYHKFIRSGGNKIESFGIFSLTLAEIQKLGTFFAQKGPRERQLSTPGLPRWISRCLLADFRSHPAADRAQSVVSGRMPRRVIKHRDGSWINLRGGYGKFECV